MHSTTINIEKESLKNGVLSLVLALVEVIRDALRIEALKRVESGDLTEDEIERLGQALTELDDALDALKKEQGIVESVRKVRDGLDRIVDEALDKIINPERWPKEV